MKKNYRTFKQNNSANISNYTTQKKTTKFVT